MLLTLLVFFIVLSVLVIVHEFGHFIVARWAGIGVLEFALGLPFTKPLWTKRLKSGMHISLYPVLFGGFVKLLGEEGPTSSENGQPASERVSGKMFFEAPVWHRIAVVVAGVFMNLILAIGAFYLFLGFSGFKVIIPRLADYSFVSPNQEVVVVSAVVKDSPANLAGLRVQDVILEANGKKFYGRDEFRKYIISQAGKPVILDVTELDLKRVRKVSMTPRENPPKGQGAIGIGIGEGVLVSYDQPQEKVLSGVQYSVDMFNYNIKVLSFLVSSAVKTNDVAPVTDNLSGPVGIASTVGDIIDIGGVEAAVQMINFLGLLSLSLAFMNILPIPAMDGGRLAFLLIEALTGKKLPSRYENWINQAGMILLLGLIAMISYNDIVKVFKR